MRINDVCSKSTKGTVWIKADPIFVQKICYMSRQHEMSIEQLEIVENLSQDLICRTYMSSFNNRSVIFKEPSKRYWYQYFNSGRMTANFRFSEENRELISKVVSERFKLVNVNAALQLKALCDTREDIYTNQLYSAFEHFVVKLKQPITTENLDKKLFVDRFK
jgi:hypothetical protein